MTSYPSALVSFTPNIDDITEVTAATVNVAYDEITAVETELGTDVAGSVTDLKTRLAKSLTGAGMLSTPDPTESTIASGAIAAPAQNFIYLDTEGDGATDDLVTITAPGAGENPLLFARIANDARNVVVKHGTGNILCAGGKDITLETTADLLIAIYDNVQDKWLATAQQVFTGGNNSWTGYNYFNGGTAGKSTTIILDATLDSSYRTVLVNAADGAITVTLPPAATYPGIEYWIKKIDATNNVTIDGDGSETIDGSATKVLSSQYAVAHIQSNGTSWDVL